MLDFEDVFISGFAPILTWSPSGAKFATSTYLRRIDDDTIESGKYCMQIVNAASGMVDHELEYLVSKDERIESASVEWNPSGTKLAIASHHLTVHQTISPGCYTCKAQSATCPRRW